MNFIDNDELEFEPLDSASEYDPDSPVTLKSLHDYAMEDIDYGVVLLGGGEHGRFLECYATMMLFGPTSIGKTNFGISLMMCMGCGQSFLDIPTYKGRVLRSISVIPHEDSDNDIRQHAYAIHKLGFGVKERELIHRNTHVEQVPVNLHYGDLFKRLEKINQAFIDRDGEGANVVMYNPLNKVVDPYNRDQVAEFLRLSEEFKRQNDMADIWIAHTPKISVKNQRGLSIADSIYAMAGNANLADHCRAILALVQTSEHGVFRLIATKRGRELDWDDGGSLERYIAHSTTLDNNRRHDVWRAATEAEITTASATSKEEKDIETLLELFNPPGKLSQAELLERAAEHELAWNQQKISRVLEDAMKAGYIFDYGKRKGKNAPKEYGRDPLKANVTTTNGNSSSHA